MLYHHFIDTIFVVVVVAKETKIFPFSPSLSRFELKEQKIQNKVAATAAVYFCAAKKRYISTINY